MPRPLKSLAIIAALLLASALARGEDPVAGLLDRLAGAQDPADRIALVRQLAGEGSVRAAAALARLVRADPVPAVRIEAAAALGRIPGEETTAILLDLLGEGGISGVRQALARSLDGEERRAALLERLDSPKPDTLGRALLTEALGEFGDPASLHALLSAAADEKGDVTRRIVSLQALSRRGDAGEQVTELLAAVLGRSRDTTLLMAALDAIRGRPDPALLPGAERALTFPEGPVREAARHAVDLLRFEAARRVAAAAAAAAAEEGYGSNPPTPPLPPPDRPRFDIVFAFDSTGSVCGHLDLIQERILLRCRGLTNLGCDVRVGVVAFRTARQPETTQVLPLTHDLDVVRRFIADVKASGADSQGAAIHLGLVEGLDRMPWRRGARRAITIVADSRCHDPERSISIAKIHLAADQARVHVLYLLRTRTKVPDSIRDLAAAGGGFVEVIE
jgi:HEAT repeat protein